jgi:four helix bundle protein
MNDNDDKGLESLQLWHKAMAFAVRIHKEILPKLPPDEKWAMGSQLRRSVQSIPANIAEGHGRFYYQDNVRFYYIARGSLEETLSYLTLAGKLTYLTEQDLASLLSNIRELRRMLNGYISYLKNSKRGINEPGSILAVRDDIAEYLIDVHIDQASE